MDTNGVANPTTATFDRLTVSNGTSSACRVDSYRNTQPNPGDNIAIEFTIRNPNQNSNWSATGGADGCGMHLNVPQNGRANTPGPFQATAGFGFRCFASVSSGQTFTQNLTLEILGPGNAVIAACGVQLWGYVTPNK